jgi:hypothetical protein
MRPAVDVIRREHCEAGPEQSRVEGDGEGPGRRRECEEQRQRRETDQAVVARELEEAVPHHRLWIAVVLAKRPDQQRPEQGGVLLEIAVCHPVDDARAEVGEDPARDQGEHHDRQPRHLVHCPDQARRERGTDPGKGADRGEVRDREPAQPRGETGHGDILRDGSRSSPSVAGVG